MIKSSTNEEIDSDLIRSGDVARMLGISQSSVWRWMKSGTLNAIRTPTNRILYHRADIHKVYSRMFGESAVTGEDEEFEATIETGR